MMLEENYNLYLKDEKVNRATRRKEVKLLRKEKRRYDKFVGRDMESLSETRQNFIKYFKTKTGEKL